MSAEMLLLAGLALKGIVDTALLFKMNYAQGSFESRLRALERLVFQQQERDFHHEKAKRPTV